MGTICKYRVTSNRHQLARHRRVERQLELHHRLELTVIERVFRLDQQAAGLDERLDALLPSGSDLLRPFLVRDLREILLSARRTLPRRILPASGNRVIGPGGPAVSRGA